MWARGTPEPSGGSGGGFSEGEINKAIVGSKSVPELETVFIERSGNFTFMNAAAALTKYAKLRGSSKGSPFFSKLAAVWLIRLEDSGSQGLANVLWACSKLGSTKHPIWAETWQAFLQFIDKDMSSNQPTVQPQNISNVLYACAKVRQQPQADELLLLLEAFLHPDVLAAASSQTTANLIWALGLLSLTPGWEAQVDQELLQQLLAPPVLAKVLEGNPQEIANVLVGLGRMCTGPLPLLSTAAAQGYAGQLLSHKQLNRLSRWRPQEITNAMWALGELQLMDERFIQAAVSAAPNWLTQGSSFNVTQAATACAQLHYRDAQFMGLLLQRGQELLQPSRGSRSRPLSEPDKASLVTMCCVSVALLDMRDLAGAARSLAALGNIKQHRNAHPSGLRRLWVFHCWLLQHQLLDGKGLAGLVSEQQLQQGAKEAEAWGDKTRL